MDRACKLGPVSLGGASRTTRARNDMMTCLKVKVVQRADKYLKFGTEVYTAAAEMIPETAVKTPGPSDNLPGPARSWAGRGLARESVSSFGRFEHLKPSEASPVSPLAPGTVIAGSASRDMSPGGVLRLDPLSRRYEAFRPLSTPLSTHTHGFEEGQLCPALFFGRVLCSHARIERP